MAAKSKDGRGWYEEGKRRGAFYADAGDVAMVLQTVEREVVSVALDHLSDWTCGAIIHENPLQRFIVPKGEQFSLSTHTVDFGNVILGSNKKKTFNERN